MCRCHTEAMVRNLIGLLVLLAMAILLASPTASAQSCVARPGLSALEQYCQSVPAPTGNRPNKSDDKRDTGSRPKKLSPGARRSSQALAQAGGTDAEDLNRFLSAPENQTAPENGTGASTTRPKAAPLDDAPRRTGRKDSGSGADARAGRTAARVQAESARPVDAGGVAAAVGSSSSSGIELLAAVAALAVLAGMGLLLLDRRRRGRIG